MDNIINWLLLVIIFVFDPLAIALVIAANFAFDQTKFKEDKILESFNNFNMQLDKDDLKDWDNTLLDGLEEDLASQQEFDILDTNKDGIVDDEERVAAQNRIQTLENEIQNTSLSGWRANKMRQEAEELKQKVTKDDNTIDYN